MNDNSRSLPDACNFGQSSVAFMGETDVIGDTGFWTVWLRKLVEFWLVVSDTEQRS